MAIPLKNKTCLNQRIRNEPIVEITQVKGTSETHPLLSPNDEWSDFEIMSTRVGSVPPTYSRPDGSYVRDALKKGLMLEQFFGGNPYNFGFSSFALNWPSFLFDVVSLLEEIQTLSPCMRPFNELTLPERFVSVDMPPPLPLHACMLS